MKICVISSSVFSTPPAGYAGLEMISYQCAKGLARLGHKVTLIAPTGSKCEGCEVLECLPPGYGEEQMYGGLTFKNANGEDVRWPGYWPKLLEFNDGGVIIDQSWQCWPALLAIEGRIRCPLLKVMHAPVATMYNVLPPEGICSFVCISEDQKNHFEALHSPRKARICYNGIDLDFYKPMETTRTDRYLFLARFSTIKGPDIAIDVCKKTGAKLDLIGDTSLTQEPELYHNCQHMADGKQIRIVGSAPRGETVWWYSQAKAFLHLNKRFREPFGLAPVEAQACGLPVAAFDFGAMRETIKPGETGFLVNSQTEIEYLISSGAFNMIDRRRCREWASQFSTDNMVRRYEQLCVEALDKRW